LAAEITVSQPNIFPIQMLFRKELKTQNLKAWKFLNKYPNQILFYCRIYWLWIPNLTNLLKRCVLAKWRTSGLEVLGSNTGWVTFPLSVSLVSLGTKGSESLLWPVTAGLSLEAGLRPNRPATF
jgi:hypothetical protein